MPNMTLALPEELHEAIKRHPEIKWSVIARDAMEAYADRLEAVERIAAKSRLTEADVEELGAKVKSGLAKRYGKPA